MSYHCLFSWTSRPFYSPRIFTEGKGIISLWVLHKHKSLCTCICRKLS